MKLCTIYIWYILVTGYLNYAHIMQIKIFSQILLDPILKQKRLKLVNQKQKMVLKSINNWSKMHVEKS